MPGKPKRLKNPGADVLPRMDPSYPLRPLIDTATRIGATVVVLPTGTGKYVASTLEDRKILVTASTRKGAQSAAMVAYVAKHAPKPAKVRRNPAFASQEEESLYTPIIRKREGERDLSAAKWLGK